MSVINPAPLTNPLVDRDAVVTSGWSQWISQVYAICFSVQQSGTTAQRPTKGLYVGRPYFDTTLGQPIWHDGSGWVDATGASA